MGEGIPTFLTVMAIHLKRKQLFKLRRLIRIIELKVLFLRMGEGDKFIFNFYIPVCLKYVIRRCDLVPNK